MHYSNRSIRELLAAGIVKIDPMPRDEDISITSIDLHLGDEIMLLKANPPLFDDREQSITDYWRRHSRTINLKKNHVNKPGVCIKDWPHGYVLKPGEVCLAFTDEHVTLPAQGGIIVQGDLWNRSRTARAFVRTHIDAPKIKPGTDNRITLEIKNDGPIPFALYHRQPIVSLGLEEIKGEPWAVNSTFHGQTCPSGRREPEQSLVRESLSA